MYDEDLGLLAYGIASYDTTIASMEALQAVGVTVPHTIIGRCRDEMAYLCLQWSNKMGDTLFNREQLGRTVTEARAYCTEHQAEINELSDTGRERA